VELGQRVALIPRRVPKGVARPANRVFATFQRHWLVAVLLAVGAVLRVLVMIAYRPALLYTDSLKYLYNAWPGTDPVGYQVPLRLILRFGSLETVAAVQHAVGLAMAVVIYTMLVRRGVSRWLAACAAAPVLLDAYQLHIEQTIIPDVWFEALIVAGLALLLWQPRLTIWAAVAAGVLLGCTATVREVGIIVILPALTYVAVTSKGWRRKAWAGTALTAAFVVPIVTYCTISYISDGHFRLSRAGASQAYGRVALASDCATLRVPPYERALCPTERQKSLLGTDGLDHAPTSPLVTYVPPRGMKKPPITASFVRTVLLQQPLNVLRGIAGDSVKLFALTRNTPPGDAPIWRWQFQARYPTYGQHAGTSHFFRFIAVNREGFIVVGLNKSGATAGPYTYRTLNPPTSGKATVSKPVASFLRAYQLNGGFTPGPLYAFAALAGLLGSLALLCRSLGPGQRDLAQACLLTFTTAAAVLLISDAFEFSWRYQLPALVTLAPAGALGIAVLSSWLGDRHRPVPGETDDQPATADQRGASPS
jgi:Dolichyl-phosphate-mannose-protein mannosyltransferase